MARRKDYYSTQAASYAAHRPGYPAPLFDYLAAAAPGRRLAWDCGCGSGQASLALAERYAAVVATDLSSSEIARAERRPNLCYAVARADAGPLADATVDLITVAQALHWFAGDGFFREARRVLRRGGVVAAWTYNLLTIMPPVDALVRALYRDLQRWWPAEQRHVENGYASLPFPFEPLPSPAFSMTSRWSFDYLLGYLGSWSAVAACGRETGRNPLARVADELAVAWGNPAAPREVRWLLTLRVGRV